MSAETVVGPSIASGSQTWSGNCALFPAAPPRIMIPATVRIVGFVATAGPCCRNGTPFCTNRKPFAAQPPEPAGPAAAYS